MYNNPQGRIEGFGVDLKQARFLGTFEVSDEDDAALSLDKVVVLLVAARSAKVEHSINDAGDVVARRVLKVSDAVPLTGEMREQAILKMSSQMDVNQGSFEWGVSEVAKVDPPALPEFGDFPVDEVRMSPGELQQFEDVTTVDVSAAATEPRLDEEADEVPSASSWKVAHRSVDRDIGREVWGEQPEVSGPVVVGMLRKDRSERADPILGKFLSEGN